MSKVKRFFTFKQSDLQEKFFQVREEQRIKDEQFWEKEIDAREHKLITEHKVELENMKAHIRFLEGKIQSLENNPLNP